ncbi:MAG TPA: hypothetical protein VMG12_10275 [Polyangiaceae bacterium]|nr:hypothetical protein [Polyangiaceae bacterium]
MMRRGVGLLALGVSALTGWGAGCSDDDAGADGGTGQATIAIERVCEMFAATFCAKAAECGLVLGQMNDQLICIDCSGAALALITAQCKADLEGEKDAAAVDRCLANGAMASCTDVCADADVPECEVLDELMGGSEGTPVECNDACISG